MNDIFYNIRNIVFFFATIMLFKYFVYMVLSPFYNVKEALRKLKIKRLFGKNPNKYEPLVSVIVPAWNEEVGVLKTINSILENTYQNVEIVVINDGSTDNTDKVMREFIRKKTKKGFIGQRYVKYINNIKNGGKGKALNTGITNASGLIILTVDSDSALHPHALANLVEYFADPDINAVVGNVKIAKNDTIIGFIQSLEYQFGFYFKRANSVMGAEYIFGGACAAFRSKVFKHIGLYDEINKTEDIEMTMRVRDAGYNCVYAENVICYTEGASSVTGLINQRLRWKKGRFDTFIRYRHMFFSTNPKHNKFLTWFILPFAMLSEVQLFFEPAGISLLLTYSVISADFLSINLGILFIFVIYLINGVFNHEGIKPKIIIAFPFSWILFYFLIWVEYLSLIHSLKMILKGENIQWQKWQRKGIAEIG